MEAHPHADRPEGESRLRVGGRLRAHPARRERDEEGVPLRVDLDAAVALKASRKTRRCSRERLGVGSCAERVQQLGRALDVGEEKGDGAGGKLGHPSNDESELGGFVERTGASDLVPMVLLKAAV